MDYLDNDMFFFQWLAGLINVMDFTGYLCVYVLVVFSTTDLKMCLDVGLSVTFLLIYRTVLLGTQLATNGFDLITILAKILLNRFFKTYKSN